MAIKDYSTTAGNNTSVNGVNIGEGCPPGNLNDAIREVMADVRALVGVSDGIGWIDLGLSPTYVSASSFSVAGNATGVFSVGRRLRIDGSTYGKITARSYIGGVTTVTVALDSGSITSGISVVAVGIPATGKPVDVSAISGLANSATIEADTAGTAYSLVRRTATGDINSRHVLAASHLSCGHDQATRNSDTVFYSSSNDYLYKNTASGFRTSLDVYSKGEADGRYARPDAVTAQTFAGPVHTTGNSVNYLTGTANELRFGYYNGNNEGLNVYIFGGGSTYNGRVCLRSHAVGSYRGAITLGSDGEVYYGNNTEAASAKLIKQSELDAAAWPGTYTGTAHNNTIFPLGSIVAGITDTSPRNSNSTVRLHPTYDWIYWTGATGPALTGTWRHRGAGGSDVTSIWQRVA